MRSRPGAQSAARFFSYSQIPVHHAFLSSVLADARDRVTGLIFCACRCGVRLCRIFLACGIASSTGARFPRQITVLVFLHFCPHEQGCQQIFTGSSTGAPARCFGSEPEIFFNDFLFGIGQSKRWIMAVPFSASIFCPRACAPRFCFVHLCCDLDSCW
jgi:hypothetical protein